MEWPQGPVMLYGTAWKKDRTATLVIQALEAGFRGVDVAAQPRHYREDLVGQGLREVWLKGAVKREDVYVSMVLRIQFLGSKFSRREKKQKTE